MRDPRPALPDYTCPACGAPQIEWAEQRAACAACGVAYPIIEGIPWLFAEPEHALAEWRLRLDFLLVDLRREASELRSAGERPDISVAARNRLKLEAAAYEDHARRVAALTTPLGPDAARVAPEMHRALGTRAPGGPGLAAYYVNLHRDWAWGRDETDAMFAQVAGALGADEPGRVLVLGAGAGRLVYDLAVSLNPQLCVALDTNPLLAIVGRRVMNGERVALYEFPLAPRDVESHAILRSLAADAPAPRSVHWVLADATRAPFAPGSFDTVVTPWLIDVIDEDLATFAPRINALLRDGGRWINTGSLVFSNADRAARYALAEVASLVAASGFSAPVVNESRTPYMCSPASRHGRIETVVTFRADKQRVVAAPPRRSSLPSWLETGEGPVPALPAFQSEALTMRIYGYLASLIDGRRSIADIANELVRERLMTQADAEPAVRGFVRRLYEDTVRRPGF